MDKLWDVFEATGRVEDYLNYRREKDSGQRAQDAEGDGDAAFSQRAGAPGKRDRGR